MNKDVRNINKKAGEETDKILKYSKCFLNTRMSRMKHLNDKILGGMVLYQTLERFDNIYKFWC